MTTYTYLMIDLLSVAFPLIFSFHPGIRLDKDWDSMLPAILVIAVIYSLWDSLFVYLGIWGFNPRYITGFKVGNMPVEELLFFVCIPYACVFTFECISRTLSFTKREIELKWFNYGFAIILLITAFVYHSKLYTTSAFIALAAIILLGTFLKITWLNRFYLAYALLLLPFFFVNGLLTGSGLAHPIVWYNPQGIIGLRILTIPVEDFFYGMGLILSNVWMYKYLKERQNRRLYVN